MIPTPQIEAAPAPDQSFGTQGLKPMERPSRVTRAFMRIVAAVERLNLRYAIHGNPCVYDNANGR